MDNSSPKRRPNVRRITVAGVLSALTIVLYFTPLSFPLIPGMPVQITFMHIPVIIAAVLEGPIVGAFVGLVFGIFSFYQATITPLPIAFAFLNPLVSVLPRIVIGIVSYYVYQLFRRILKNKNHSVSIGAAAAAGTITNTLGVLGMIYVLYAQQFVNALGIKGVAPAVVVFGLSLPNSPLELIAAIVVCIPVVVAVSKVSRRV